MSDTPPAPDHRALMDAELFRRLETNPEGLTAAEMNLVMRRLDQMETRGESEDPIAESIRKAIEDAQQDGAPLPDVDLEGDDYATA